MRALALAMTATHLRPAIEVQDVVEAAATRVDGADKAHVHTPHLPEAGVEAQGRQVSEVSEGLLPQRAPNGALVRARDFYMLALSAAWHN